MTIYSYLYDRDNNHCFVEHILPTKRFKHLPKIEEEPEEISCQSEKELKAIKDKFIHEGKMSKWQHLHNAEIKK